MSEHRFSDAFTLILKVLAALFIIKVVVYAMGYQMYIPVADEIFGLILRMLFLLGGRGGVAPMPGQI